MNMFMSKHVNGKVVHYILSRNLRDEVTAKKWNRKETALYDIVKYLSEKIKSEDDNDPKLRKLLINLDNYYKINMESQRIVLKNRFILHIIINIIFIIRKRRRITMR